eukprot:3939161-Rhodomonas_salina.1
MRKTASVRAKAALARISSGLARRFARYLRAWHAVCRNHLSRVPRCRTCAYRSSSPVAKISSAQAVPDASVAACSPSKRCSLRAAAATKCTSPTSRASSSSSAVSGT